MISEQVENPDLSGD